MTRFPEQKTDPTATTPVDAMVVELRNAAYSAGGTEASGRIERYSYRDQANDLARQLTARLSAPTLDQIEAAIDNVFLWNKPARRKTALKLHLATLYTTQSKEAPE